MTRLDEIRERDNKATKGPWDKRVAGIEGDNYMAGTGPWYRMSPFKEDNSINDADFIANAKSDIPWLLDRIAEARVIIESVRLFKPGFLELSVVQQWLKETE